VARVKIQRIRSISESVKVSDAPDGTARPQKETRIAHTDS
jgi:hypothetical protein